MDSSQTEQLNVLVIDDDPSMLELLQEIIHSVEHQVVTAKSAEEGLELLPFWTFQVAFIDQKLPGMDGLVLGEFLRRNNPDMTIALVTGDDDRRLVKKSRDLAIVHIPKPFEVNDILGVLSAYTVAASQRLEKRLATHDEDYAPRFGGTDLAASFGLPNVPERVGERMVETIKSALNNLRSVARYTEKDRVTALSGLIAARVLGIDLPRAKSDRTLYEEYDELMRHHGRRVEFTDEPRQD